MLAPTTEDAALSLDILGAAGLACTICFDAEGLAHEMEQGAAAILLTEGIVAGGNPDSLIRTIRRQPEWSDIPVLLLAGGGADSPAAKWLMESLGNVTMLERPVRIITLVSAVRSAIKARRRQYQVREQLLMIRRAQEDLQLEARRKDEFLATLAHELRNPLAPITNSLGLLHHERSSAEQRQYAIELIRRQVSHMVRLVDDLLDLSRITRGSVELRLEPVDIPAVVNAAVDAARPLIDANHHRLAVILPPERLVIVADAVRLTQILTNLLNNAAKYTAPGGSIELRCSLTPDDADGCLEVTVTDSGVGIPPEMLHRVFDMFAQVDHTRMLAQGGLGIGLTLVRRLVELHGGSVEARSEGPDRGSQFVVRLPVHRPPDAVPRPGPAAEPAASDRQAVGAYGA